MWIGATGAAFAERADQTAMSLPRPATTGGAAGLPQPLAPSEAARLRRIFELQAKREIAAAEREAERLEDTRLLGHVLADRWLEAGAPARPDQLQAWLAQHADHPDAPAIHALLARRAPRGMRLPPAPRDRGLAEDLEVIPEESLPAGRAVRRNPALDRSVRERAREGDAPAALALVQRTRGMTAPYAALLRADIAEALFQRGEDEAAFRLASEGARSVPGLARPAFVAGLAAFALDRPDLAFPYLEAAARAEDAAAVQRSAAAFWTARAAVRARRPAHYVPWMVKAAQEPRTFYGLLARRALGLASGFAWESELAGAAEGQALAETAGGWRALALLQVGQAGRAEAELRALWPAAQGNAALSRAMIAVASAAGMTHLAAQVAALVQSADGRPRDFARFPLPRLEPEGGFRIDPSLLYALARQESNFDPDAVSRAGARGLLQVMPATASYVTRDPSLAGDNAHRLHDPGFGLEVGQRYVAYLARHEAVRGDLLRLLAAYNAGPGNIARWERRDDPFLALEAIPIPETRAFVQRVLAYAWIYASRLGLPAPSLDALATGQFPRFAEPEEVTAMLRAGGRGAAPRAQAR
jgi:soluble lytic murein transglycosylase-like protein